MPNDFDIEASRAVTPYFYRAPEPGGDFKLAQYQHAGAEYALNRNHALVGDAPGVGKTAEGVAISNAIEAKRTLVVCPASLRLNWEREIWRWSTIPNVQTYVVAKAADGISHKADYVVISYALMANPGLLDALLDLRWDHVILDEAHALKDPKGNTRTRVICAPDCLPSVTGRFTMLSGTILPNQPIECYNACRLLNWDAIDRMSLEDFRDYYYAEGEGYIRGKVWHPEGQYWRTELHYSSKVRNRPVNLDDLQYRLRKHIMVRRLKEQVLHELPPKRWHMFPLSLSGEMRSALKHPGWAQAERLYEIDADAFNGAIPVDGEFSTARRLLGEAKAPQVAEYAIELLESGIHKVMVAAWNHSVLDLLRAKLDRYGLAYMDGRTSGSKKQAAADSFQTDPAVRVILGQTQVIGEGWTLTAAQDAVLAEPDPVPGRNDQVLDRLHRKGQLGNVTGHVPVVPGTLDERMLALAIGKDRNIYRALDA